MILRILFLVLIFIGLGFSVETFAQSEGILNQLLAPGPLILGHAKLEGKDCLKCHEAGKGVSVQLCVNCHKEVGKQVESKKGFHAIAMKNKTCIECHSDHKGRDYDSTQIDEKKFDHFLKTGYDLKGKHAELKCSECHTEKRTNMAVRKTDIRFLSKPSTCVSCHKKDDIHFFKGDYAQKDCNACHSNNSWKKDITFNHNTDTKFKLVEKHAQLKCQDCHVSGANKTATIYKWPELEKKQCLNCHDNFHKSNLSAKFSSGRCTDCHNQTAWTIAKFKHDVTGFKLNGKHEIIKCIDCHKPKNTPTVDKARAVKDLNFTGLKSNCLSCHQDYHKFNPQLKFSGKPLNNCLSCHTETDWKKSHSFDHNRHTNYKIDGKHLELKCSDCHLPNVQKNAGIIALKLPTYKWHNLSVNTCESCHISPHKNEFSRELQQKKCSSCHTTDGWFSQKTGGFDHSKTRFTLTGAHSSTRCSDCHGPTSKQVFKFKSVESKFCIDCHQNIHQGQFKYAPNTQNCLDCHDTQNFKTNVKFDHNKTQFKLSARHAELKCNDCHTPLRTGYKLKWPNFHLNTKTESKQTEKIIAQSKFQFANLAKDQCLTCHEDFHMGQLGANCLECHNEQTWKQPKFDHNTQSRFKIVGQHKKLKCSDCHLQEQKAFIFSGQKFLLTRFKPMKTNCIDCHSDYHVGQLGQNCQTCHNENDWKKTTFNHNTQSRFKLNHKHAETACFECHKLTNRKIEHKSQIIFARKFKPINTACYECHKDPHKGSFGRSCVDCHTDKNWKAVKDFHKNFSISGVHYTLDCAECHKDGRKLAGTSNDCLLCHQKDDVHNGSLPNCKECHNQQFWDVAKFRHSMSRFSLRGAHRVIECTECHRNGIYKGLSSDCVSCHLQEFNANPAPHVSGNTRCTDCHRNTFTFGDADD